MFVYEAAFAVRCCGYQALWTQIYSLPYKVFMIIMPWQSQQQKQETKDSKATCLHVPEKKQAGQKLPA